MPVWPRRRGPPATADCCENAPDGPSVRIPRDTELVVVFAAPPNAGKDDSDD